MTILLDLCVTPIENITISFQKYSLDEKKILEFSKKNIVIIIYQ